MPNTFSADLQLSSDDYCPKLGGSTALSLAVKSVLSQTSWGAILGMSMGSVAATTLYSTNTPIGVYGQVTSAPTIPLTVTSVSAVLRDFADQSQSTTYSGIFTAVVNRPSSGPYYYDDNGLQTGGTASFAFDLPTGARTAWLVTGGGQSHSVVLSVSVTVSYTTPASIEPIVVSLDVPLKPNGRGGYESLAQSGHDGAADTIVPSEVATVTSTTSLTVGDAATSSPSTSMTPGAIAGIAVGSAAALILIVIVIGVLLRKKKAGYQPPAAAPAEPAAQV